ncbi:MAG: peptide deformylase [Bacteroidota bacterium]
MALGQEQIELEFAANPNGDQIRLDSICTENLTAGGDTMIYFPATQLTLSMASGINEQDIPNTNSLAVTEAYPNPTSDFARLEVYTPGKELHIRVLDIAGKSIYEKSFNTKPGVYVLDFQPGKLAHYTLSIRAGNQIKSAQILSAQTYSACKLSLNECSGLKIKNTSEKSGFSFTTGDELEYTAYTTVCGNVETEVITDQPADSTQYTFDFTWLTNIQPAPPEDLTAQVSDASILWEWSDVDDCDGYKYNTDNNYAGATDAGTDPEYLQEGLNAGTNYQLYVWAYNDCGPSYPLHIHSATEALPFTQEENDSITSGSANQSMDIMNIFEQPDSMILRNHSTNVLLDEENLQLLTDRMRQTVGVEPGLGIAAPQIGINRRIIWVQRYDTGMVPSWEVYYNPRILQYSDTIVQRNDGCLSVPTGSEYPDVGDFSYRAIWVDIEYYTADGTRVVERVDHQYTAHIFQHEIDHLNGVMFFDRQDEEEMEKYTIIEGDAYEGLPEMD